MFSVVRRGIDLNPKPETRNLKPRAKRAWTDKFFVRTARYKDNDGILLQGDSWSVLREFPPESVNMILTDPDYSKGDMNGYDLLGKLAPRLLVEGGFLMVEAPHEYHPQIHMIMHLWGGLQFLYWWWPVALLYLEGSHPRMRGKGIEITYKPYFIYCKKKKGKLGFMRDSFPVKHDKSIHVWQKSDEAYAYYIKHLCPKGGIVLDPFAGSCATARGARKAKRKWVCVEVNYNTGRMAGKQLRKK